MRRSNARARKRAFTLIEVMAAVFMLGLFVAAISQLLTQARLNEGHARRQAHAAGLADLEIARIEEELARGAAPKLGESDHSVDAWTIVSEVSAFDASALAGEASAEAEPRRSASAQDGNAGSWLASPSAQQAPPILEIAVRVSWDGAPVDADSGEPFAIRRRSFALNPAALETLADADADAEAGGGGAEDDELEDEFVDEGDEGNE